MNPQDKKPDNFDWVSARFKCSVGSIFEQLKLLITQDVELRNKLRIKKNEEPWFKVVGTDRSFSVIAEHAELAIHQTVTFSLNGQDIVVASVDGVIFRATVTLNNNGDCKPQIDGQEYDLWQLRKMALEKLFFKNYTEM
jgi:hypothetical protein